MTQKFRTQSVRQGRSVSSTDVVRDEAAGVGQSVKDAGGHVGQTATDQVMEVAAETKQQARSLLEQGRQQLHEQAAFRQEQLALRLTTVADELRELAHSSSSDTVGELTRHSADQLHQVASWLHDREPSALIDEVRSFARRRPGVFLLGAALAGVVAGRLTGASVPAIRQAGESRSTVSPTPPVPQVRRQDTGTSTRQPAPVTTYTAPPSSQPPVGAAPRVSGTSEGYPQPRPPMDPTQRMSRYPDDEPGMGFTTDGGVTR